MDNSKKGLRSAVTWVLVDLVFLVVIGILMYNYISAGKANGKEAAYNQINSVVTSVSAIIGTEADLEVEVSRSIKEFASSRGLTLGDEETVAYAKSIVDNTKVNHIMFCDGNRVVCDESGKTYEDFDLSFCQRTSETDYYLSESTPYGKYTYLVSYTKGEGTRYILAYIALDNMATQFKTDDMEGYSFLAIYDAESDKAYAFSKYADKDCEYLSAKKMLETISDNMVYKSSGGGFLAKINQDEAVAADVKLGEDSRVISAIDTGISNWYVVLGLRSYNAGKRIESIVTPVKSAVYKLFAVTAMFSIFVVVTVIAMTVKNKEKGRVLENKADTDLLTDLLNKDATERKIKEYLTNNPNGRGLLFLLDIDNFKKINDTMGHAFGDTLLKTLGKEISTEFRVTDIIGRTGGDEFMIFLKDVTDDVIVEREANRIARFFHDFKAGGDYVKYSATASIGAAIFPEDAKNFKDLYVAADQALYRAKKRGKNQLVFYNENDKRS